MIDSWLLAPGSYDDRKPMVALLENRKGLAIIGDKGYVDQDLENRLWESGEHLLMSLKRGNQAPWPDGIRASLVFYAIVLRPHLAFWEQFLILNVLNLALYLG
jgi:hypothetical protein